MYTKTEVHSHPAAWYWYIQGIIQRYSDKLSHMTLHNLYAASTRQDTKIFDARGLSHDMATPELTRSTWSELAHQASTRLVLSYRIGSDYIPTTTGEIRLRTSMVHFCEPSLPRDVDTGLEHGKDRRTSKKNVSCGFHT